MPKLINPDNDEISEELLIEYELNIVEITGWSLEYIRQLPEAQYKYVLNYCIRRVAEKKAGDLAFVKNK